jgi:hypothetical protein
MTEIPQSTKCIYFCSYMQYIEWDILKEQYVSENNKNVRDAKLEDIAGMTDDMDDMDKAGYEFLLAVEMDPIVKKVIWKSYKHFEKTKKN